MCPSRGGNFVCARLIRLVEHAEHALARRMCPIKHTALARLARLAQGKDPHDGVGFDEKGARHTLVFGPQRVGSRRVDHLDLLQHRPRVEDSRPCATAPAAASSRSATNVLTSTSLHFFDRGRRESARGRQAVQNEGH